MTSDWIETTAGELASALADTTVVGLGESTRFSHETFVLRDELFRRLVEDHGFRALALQDAVVVGERLDGYVRGGAGTATDALDGAWRPWRTTEMAAAVDWIRAFNGEHPDDPIRILGITPAQAQPTDYDAVLDRVRELAPGRIDELASHLNPIRSAHEIDEHVQAARGIHPGRPFAEHARDALAIIVSLPGVSRDDAVLAQMRRVVDYHERSVAGSGSYAGEAELWAETISDYQHRTGVRVAFWDGLAHTAATPVTLGLALDRGPQPTVGSVLRKHYGTRYASVAIGFHHGDLGVAVVGEPEGDLVDARLAEVDRPVHWVDLRNERGHGCAGPAKVRVISGVYDPSRDAAEYLAVESLSAAFDVLVQIRQVSPTRRSG